MPFIQTSATRRDQDASLPSQLQGKLPQCAESCLISYISQEYSCDSEDFTCLCTTYSNQGYTLGELSYVCLDTNCPGYSASDAHSLYDICDDQTKAVEPTRTPLAVPSSSLVVPTSIATATGTPSTSTIPSNSFPSDVSSRTTSQSSTQASTPSSGGISTTTKSNPTAVAAASTPAGSNNATSLSSGQAVGISLAAFGGIALIIGGIFLLSWWRRRRICKVVDEKNTRDSYDFIDDAPPRFSPFNYGYADPRGPLGGFHYPRAELDGERRRTQWPSNLNKPLPVVERRDVSSTRSEARSATPGSPNSIGSQRTVSQLLPDKPIRTPPMPAFQRVSRPPSVYTQATVFEEEDLKSPQVSKDTAPPMPMPPKSAHKARSNNAMHAHLTKQQKAQSPPLPMSLTLQIPKQAPRQERIPSPIKFAVAPRPPPSIREESSDAIGIAIGSSPDNAKSRVYSNHSDFPLRSGASLIPDYYTSVESGTPDFGRGSTMSLTEDNRNYDSPNLFESPAQLIRRSTSSDTSFESNDLDEETPPENEEARLSPVVESGSPIRGVKYPKVPRSSNQIVPRSPLPQPSPRSTLLQQPSVKNSVDTDVPQDSIQLCKPIKIARKPVHQPKLVIQPHPAAAAPKTPPRQPSDDSTSSELGLSGTTLAVKRRGHTAARSLEKGLRLDTASMQRKGSTAWSNASASVNNGSTTKINRANRTSRSESPLKGYGQITKTGAMQQQQIARPPVPENMGKMMGRPDISMMAQRNPPSHLVYSPPPSLAMMPAGQQQQQRYPHPYAMYAPPQTPHWSPELTPGRSGDDFFFSLRLASEDSPPARPARR